MQRIVLGVTHEYRPVGRDIASPVTETRPGKRNMWSHFAFRIGMAGCFRRAATAKGMQRAPACLGAFTPGSAENQKRIG